MIAQDAQWSFVWENVQVGFSIEIIQFIVCKLGWKNQSLPILSYFQLLVQYNSALIWISKSGKRHFPQTHFIHQGLQHMQYLCFLGKITAYS